MPRRSRKNFHRKPAQPAAAPSKHELVGMVRRVDASAGFFIPEDKGHADLYLKGHNLRGAQDRDKVRVKALGPARAGYRAEGQVLEIIERGVTRLVGELRRHGAFYYLLPLAYRFYETININDSDLNGARENDRVVAEIIDYQPLKARVTEVIGPSGSPDVELKTVTAKYEVPADFPPAVLRASEMLPSRVDGQAAKGRVDLRHLPILTIDPIDARDLDDAISFERGSSGDVRVGVHIADVSSYVSMDTTLDEEAVERATSIYLVDGVVPMLPPKLSNGICSLNAAEDRLALSAFLNYSPDGELRGATFERTVIRVRRRFHYDEVDEILESGRYPDAFEFLPELSRLAQRIRARRSAQGSIDFDLPEVKLTLDEAGKVKDVRVMTHTVSHQLIEEYMIAANVAVAEFLTAKQLPMIYRIHAEPEKEKLLFLEQFLLNLGVRSRILRGKGEHDKPRPSTAAVAKKLQLLLSEVKGGQWEKVVNYQLLRSMPKAIYSTQNIGHFGLGSRCYCHFTSPIRRYPDLTVHRMLSSVIQGRIPSQSELKKIQMRLSETAKHCTEQEIKAAEAERESVKVKLLEDMLGRVGQVYMGTVSGVVSFGMFIQLPNTVEGLLHASTMKDDRYEFSEVTASMVGRRSGRRYRFGDEIRVRVERVDLPLRQLDLSFVT